MTASAFFCAAMKTYIYVDGFNLYYGALKGTPYKWLDLAKLCQSILPKNQIVKIKYFTARVSARPDDPQQPARQQAYLRALSTIPNLEIIYGRFLSSKVHMRLTNPPVKGSPYVQVYKMEEKGSDVNLGVHLLHDGHLSVYEVAIVISNDSDLVEPIRLVQQDLQKPVGILNPYAKPSHVLK